MAIMCHKAGQEIQTLQWVSQSIKFSCIEMPFTVYALSSLQLLTFKFQTERQTIDM